jgi:hypothetical protein
VAPVRSSPGRVIGGVTGEVGYPKVLDRGAEVRSKTREGDGGQIAREERSNCQRQSRIEYKRHCHSTSYGRDGIELPPLLTNLETNKQSKQAALSYMGKNITKNENPHEPISRR